MTEPNDTQLQAIAELLFQGRKIEAIKLYREATREGLAESKQAVEAFEAELRESDPQRFTAKPAGCGAAAVLMLLAVAGVWVLLSR